MVLGALLDLGLPLDSLRAALGSLAIECGEIGAERVLRAGVSATKFLNTAAEAGASPAPSDWPSREHSHSHDDGHPHAHGHSHSHTHGHAHVPARRSGAG